MRLVIVLGLASALCGADWPRYRGPNGDGVSPEKNLPVEIGADKNVAWKVATLKGHSSPIAIGGRVLFTGWEGDQRYVLCYEAAKGTELWRKGIAKVRSETAHPLNGPTTPTLATDGKNVFAFFPEFGLVAYDLEGKELWRTAVGPFGAIQGMAVSPVYAEGLVTLLIDTPDEASLRAYDAKTGKEKWKAERPVGVLGSYATPSLYKPANGPLQLIVAGAVELTAYQVKTGERLWWARGVSHAPAALPLVAGDSVYTLEPSGDTGPPFSALSKPYDKNQNGLVELAELDPEKIEHRIMHRLFGAIDKHYGNKDGAVSQQEYDTAFDPKRPGGGLVRVKLNGKGDVSATHVVWRHTKGLPYVTAPLLLDGVLYSVRNGGILSTFDAETGKVLKEARLKDAGGEYYASPVAAEGRIYFFSKDGKATVVKGGAEWEVVSSGDLGEQIIATPAIADGRLFVRTAGHLYCFGSK
ncbi:MAG: PQQ-binding-like beta-propeller repeat protein [Bryobacteraceae bacterium]|nr:PQQ-binding-like beta-propeller repeat protein [Bryobacteraceae bacterium]